MSDALNRVVSRAISDAAFRRQLQTNPTGALKEFDLSAAEVAALTSSDPTKLTALGIDQRMSRMAVLMTETGSSISRVADAADVSYASASIDAGAGGPVVGSVDAGIGGPVLGSVDAGTGAAGGVESVDVGGGTGAGLPSVAIGTGSGPDGLDVERLGADPAAGSAGVWTTDNPYGTDRLDRIEGSDHTDLGASASDSDTPTDVAPEQPI